MTNKPMLSVERELLESFAAYVADSPNAVMRARVAQLRALLDRPAYPDRLCHADKNAHPYICGCLKGDAEAQRRFDEHHSKAAQHQGEPEGWVLFKDGKLAWEHGEEIISTIFESHLDARFEWRPFFTEQPVPLKIGAGVTIKNVGFDSERDREALFKFDSDGYLESVNLSDLSILSKNKTHSIDGLEAAGVLVEHPAPVVVVPQFDMQMVMMCVGGVRGAVLTSNQCHALAQMLNACSAEVARLNGVKP